MTLRAILRDGTEVELDPKYRTLEDVMRLLDADSLTGSAMPFATVMLDRADGGEPVSYAEVNTIVGGTF